MPKYRVIENFKDLEDNEYIYLKNVANKNIYPRKGLEPTQKRIKELSTDKNKLGKPLIEEIKEETEVNEKNNTTE